MASSILRSISIATSTCTRTLRPRTFATTRLWRSEMASTLTSTPSLTPALLMASPTVEYIEQEELDVQVVPAEEIQLKITERAAEQLRAISTKQKDAEAGLRIAVESGGCHGYQYKIELSTGRNLDDYHLSHPTVRPSNVVIDAVSLSLLNGSSVDYSTELIGSSFKILNNPHAKNSGCGCGVSWELKE